MTSMGRTLGSQGALVLDEAARRRRTTIRWPDDSDWLSEITPAPQRLLSRLKGKGVLYAAGSNRYVIAPTGTRSIRQAASPELLADLAFRPHGDYYVGFLSALIAHHLTDLHSSITYVAMRRGTKPRLVPDGYKVAELPEEAWPRNESGDIERIRIGDSKEFFYRSSLERTLVDGLLRPELSGGIETVVGAWARAKERPEVRWDRLAEIALSVGGPTLRRSAFLLRQLGFATLVEARLPELGGSGANIFFDRSRGFDLPKHRLKRDRDTGITINVPIDYLRGWIEGASIG
jgi:predicted transcriptional regulator of viral defense system